MVVPHDDFNKPFQDMDSSPNPASSPPGASIKSNASSTSEHTRWGFFESFIQGLLPSFRLLTFHFFTVILINTALNTVSPNSTYFF